MLLVSLPEEARIVETSPQYTLITMANQTVRIAISIQDSKEVRQQIAGCMLDSKIFLMVAHHRDQNFFR